LIPKARISAHSKNAILLLTIVAVAVFFRFVALNHIPPGVFSDEALNGNEGIHAWRSRDLKVFYPTNNGREGIWINLIGFSESIFGTNPFGLRVSSAIVGSLTVFCLYLLAAELQSVRTGLLSAWFLATSFWHIALSRLALRAIAVPLLFTASLYLLFRSMRPASAKSDVRLVLPAISGGFLFGLGFHTYIAYRFTPFVVLALFWAELQRHRKLAQPIGPCLRVFTLWLSAAIGAALPIGLYFMRHPGDFFARSEQVWIFAESNPLVAFSKGLLLTAAMFNVKGDCAWLYNLGCSPQLLPPVGLLFVLGVGLSLRRACRQGISARTECLLLVWFLVMLLPTLLTGGPSALRSVGVLPPVFLFVGIGAEFLLQKLANRRTACHLMLAAVIAIGGIEAYRYFFLWANDSRVADEFDAPRVAIGRFLNSLPESTSRYVAFSREDDDIRIPYNNLDGSAVLLPISAETVLFETQGHPTPTFLCEDEVEETTLSRGGVLVLLEPDPRFYSHLKKAEPKFKVVTAGEMTYATVD
jgi:4-amino-4-deoxy-L-arabinose transferase-like glycosyltransferase